MDTSEYTKILFSKIQKIEPENVTKIIGYLLLQDNSDREIIHLALGPDQLIHEVIFKAKTELQQLATASSSPPISPSLNPLSSRPFLSPTVSTTFHAPVPYWDPQQLANWHNSDFMPGYVDSALELQKQSHLLGLEDQMEAINLGILGLSKDGYFVDSTMGQLAGGRSRRFSSSLPDYPVKICHYHFNKGFCKHGDNCRYSHALVAHESLSNIYGNDGNNEDLIFRPGSIETLELEIIGLLKSRRGNPVSIASLPMVYFERYGKLLQADGYLAESKRHGKVGYSLTRLLARLKNTIRLIDRPHGQHAVILAEDAPKYLDNRSERNDPGPIVSGSRQIYLTFPAESTFTEDDVSNYFSTFGLVEDVRIPCQQKRMFGFVTFVSADTVRLILAKGNPYFVCGARVLVKPYREKSKLVDRKYHDRIEHPFYYSPHYVDLDSDIQSMSRGYETSRMLKRQLIEEQEQALELERRNLAELNLVRRPLSNLQNLGYSMDQLRVSEDKLNFPNPEQFNYLLNILNSSSSTNNNKPSHNDIESSQGLNLPDSPFAPSVDSGIYTAT